MRVDKFLKVSRIIKRRTVAKEASDAGVITINGRPAKASSHVKEGDILELTFPNSRFKAKVLSTPEHVLKDGASELYEVVEP